mmetsp:Transcript_38576/g.102019  ORF Transcript_38576/g.102019 Transcript_38576/m.102019 type:complete len:278 (+) Transcript_38576:89-922(+)
MSGYAMEESIYNIIPPKPVTVERPPMHRSKYNPKMPPTASTFHTGGSTHPHMSNMAGELDSKPVANRATGIMGKAPGVTRNDPNEFMRAGARTEKVLSLLEVKKVAPETLQPTKLSVKNKPDVPRRDEAPVMNLCTSKNYVVANAVETILAAPKKLPDNAKDYLKKEDFGKVPKYLQHVKKDIQAEYDYIGQLQQAQYEAQQPQVRAMDENERLALIDGLKAKWESVNTEYQAQTHLTKLDTMGKIKRKEKFEAQLAQIEKDIEKLNRKNIVVHSSM